MKQLKILPDEPAKACAFTGHRILEKDFSKRALLRAIKRKISEGTDTFLCGMATGFDLIAGELLAELKKKNPQIRLLACIPCFAQEKYYSIDDQERYFNLLKVADERIMLSENYYRGCMQARDRYMADRADCLIAYCKKEKGGTAYTVRYFQKKKPNGEIIFV